MILEEAVEYNAATNRISSALQTLRDEMKTLRHQDVTLMRQFITMNDTIRSISKDQKSEKTRKKRLRNRTLIIPAHSINQTMSAWQIPLVRQQSVPRFCDVIPEVRERTWSCSSGESEVSSQDESLSNSVSSLSLDEENNSGDDTITTAVPVFRPPLLRQRSRSVQTPKRTHSQKDTPSKVEDILKSNIRLWKAKQIDEEESDNVFDSDSSNEDRS